ncbi:MAG: MFS transporter [Anaerolineaceae bacterium]|nr:MFS transporter [Anaerolineaceae bacterium]
MKLKLLTYKKAFYSLWAGQSLSLLGSGLTRFALMVWAYQNNGSVTEMVLLGFFSALAFMVCSPFAGVVVDRVNRKWIMFLADFASGIVTLLLLVLTLSGKLSFWQLYVAEGLSGAFEAFQSPAFFSSVSLLMPRTEYTRSNALIGLAKSFMQVLAPALSSVILTFGGLDLVMKIDLLTLLPGLLAVLFIELPIPERSVDGQKAQGDFWHEFRFGFGYIFSRPGLRIITIVFMGVNLFAGLTYMSILSPMILTHTGGDKIALGTVQTVMGVGGILGGLILSFWHSPKKKVALFAWTTALSFLICDTLMAFSRNVWSWSLSGFLAEVTIPFMVSPFYSIWQERVPTDVQGRVFSVREMLLSLPSPIGFLVGGLLADHVFEPFFAHPNLLSPLLGWGPGVGMSAMFLASAMLGSLIGWLGVFHPEARKLDLA